MNVEICSTKEELGSRAAADGATAICAAIAERGGANIVVACAASQFEVLACLRVEPAIAWNRVTVFHLDEYLGIPLAHPASFRRYLWERFIRLLPLPVRATHYLNGEDDARAECHRVGEILQSHPIDVAFVGIGENGHLAFNDPPADFETDEAYHVVELDNHCRAQQLGEGWFSCLEDVPTRAISMSVRQILKSRTIICSVPDERKAAAVHATLESQISPLVPASILRQHSQATLYLDEKSSSWLRRRASRSWTRSI